MRDLFDFTLITSALAVATIINSVVAYTSWRRRHTRPGRYFAYAMLGITLWTFAAMLGYAVVPLAYKVLFATLEAWGYMTAMPLLTLCTIVLAGNEYWLQKRAVQIFFIFVPLSTIALVSTNSLHGWVWTSFVASEQNVVIFEHGPAFSYILLCGYTLVAIMLVNLLQLINTGSQISRLQGQIMLAANVLPVAANLVYHFALGGIRGVDWTSITYSLSALLYLYALYGAGLINLVPIARRQIVENLRDGMIALDTENRIIDMNQAAIRLWDNNPYIAIGNKITEFLPLKNILLETPANKEVHHEFALDDNQRYVDLLISPIVDKNKVILGRLLIFRDITRRKQNELRLLQLTQAVEQSPVSVIVTDLNGRIEYANPQFSLLTGYTLDEVRGKNANISQSGQTPNEKYRTMWQTILSKRIWRGEFLNKKKNGDLYWEAVVIGPVLDTEDNIISFIATKEDITRRKEAEDTLRTSEERFRQLIMGAPDAVFGINASGYIVFANHRANTLLGYENDPLTGKQIEIIVPAISREKHAYLMADYFSRPHTRIMTSNANLTAVHRDGTEIPVEINLSHAKTANGPLVIAYMRDVTERKKAADVIVHANQQLTQQLNEIETLQAALQEQVIRDPLTLLFNRRYLNESIEQEFHRAKRNQEPISIILLDIDRFKAVNDTYGHTTGDACLLALARTLRAFSRKSDITCRYGGEEFLVVLPNTSVAGALRHAETLRTEAEKTTYTYEEKNLQFTISLGVSTYPQHGSTYIEIINKADEALYASKRNGRNRVTVWEEGLA